jgi:hypothetical protein
MTIQPREEKVPGFFKKFNNTGEKATSKGWGGKAVTYLS